MKSVKEIQKIAQSLLAQAEVKKAPVPVERLARMHQIAVRFEPSEGEVSGFLHRTPTKVVIGINSLHAPVRQRFTLAHELGHFFLHKSETLHVDERFLRDPVSGLATDPKEMEANRFAAELLMPIEFLMRDLHGKKVDQEDDALLRKLAKMYEVSVQAMTIRVSSLSKLK